MRASVLPMGYFPLAPFWLSSETKSPAVSIDGRAQFIRRSALAAILAKFPSIASQLKLVTAQSLSIIGQFATIVRDLGAARLVNCANLVCVRTGPAVALDDHQRFPLPS